MPTSNVLNRNFEELFNIEVRFKIPFFQRGYAWEQRQWKKLFEDIQSEIIDNVSNNKFEDTVEHILPQTLNNYWKTYLNGDATHYNLPTITNTIGNLCLNSPPANSSFGQKSFAEKQMAYTSISALARDVKSRIEPWNISAIEKRSNDLALKALVVWKWNL